MKIRIARFFVVVVALIAGVSYSDQSRSTQSQKPKNYQITHLPSLGGTSSAGNSINNRRWVSGVSDLSDETTKHAALWRAGSVTDLGTLGGPSSAVLWPVKNNRGLIVGVSETEEDDPLDEDWSCSAFIPASTKKCVGFAWIDDVMTALPTLGGNNGFATGANNRGEIVGWAENDVEDSTCNPPQVLQFRAVLWGPDSDQIQELPPLEGDTVSSATAINDKGQVVGISGICSNAVGGLSAASAVIWENGTPTDIGNLGGVAWNTPMAINNNGAVVGFSNVDADDGDSFNARAFRWTKQDGIQNLGTLPGHALSQALGVNKKGQVVGMSCAEGFDDCRAFLWQNGVMTDLNTLAPEYTGHLIFANDINDAGKITGSAVDADSGDVVAYLAAPKTGNSNLSALNTNPKPKLQMSNSAKEKFLSKLGGFASVAWKYAR